MILTCTNIKKSYTNDILKEVSFGVNKGEKIGLIGVNGAGKSTLFKILTGEIDRDGGELVFAQGAKVGYMSQGLPDLSQTVHEALLEGFAQLVNLEKRLEEVAQALTTATDPEPLIHQQDQLNEAYKNAGGYLYKSRINGVMKGLGFDPEMKLERLSGGQKTLVIMAKLLLKDTDLLLLDEPTNHLDLASIAWLEGFLRDYKGAVVVISHDRYFMNKIASKIIELEHGKTTIYHGNYDHYVVKKEEIRETETREFENQQQEIKKLEESIKTLRQFNREKSIKRARSKEKALDRIEVVDRPTTDPRHLSLNLTMNQTSGNDVLTVRDLTTKVGERVLLSGIDLEIKKGEKVALIGPVGIGKTTLFKTLTQGQLEENRQKVKFGSRVDLAFYEQHQEDGLNLTNTIFEEIHDTYPHLTRGEIRSALASFVFMGDDVFKQVASLSGGEKARVHLTKIMLQGANFLMLDEPTNHLDLVTKEVLEAAINQFKGTVFYISHDRYFINKTATRIIEIGEDGVTNYLGNYDYYLEKKEMPEEAKAVTVKEETKTKSDWVDKKKDAAEARKRQSRLKKVEEDITKTETAIQALEVKLTDPNIVKNHVELNQVYKEKEALDLSLEQLYEEWEDLQDEG